MSESDVKTLKKALRLLGYPTKSKVKVSGNTVYVNGKSLGIFDFSRGLFTG